MDDIELEAIQNVVDRVSAYQDGAQEGTVERELRSALGETGVDLDDDQVARLVAAIEADPGSVSAAAVLG